MRHDKALECRTTHKGWDKLLNILWDNILNYCKSNKIDPPNVEQIKEKFGGLRFYISDSADEYNEMAMEGIYGMIRMAESMSYTICEVCGEPGRPDTWGRYWVKTACEEHGEERRNAK